jgi:uncharacterized protein (TIGR02117 family)
MKTTLKITLLLIAGLIGFILLYLVLAFALSRITVKSELPLEEEIEIYIISNGVHTDLVVPIKSDLYDWSKQVCFEHTLSKDTSYHYLAMGWGDKGFYLETPAWKDLKASVAFNAAFGLSSTAIHATFYKTMTVSETCKKINISKAQYQCLINYILDSFQKDKDGRFIHIITKAVYGYNDAFYDAKGSYSLFHTCNTWANNGLKACGQKACLWTPFDTGIFLNYE